MAKTNPMDQDQKNPAEVKPQPAPAAPIPGTEASRAQIIVFAAGLAFFLVLARALDVLLPGISESRIERWVMLGFGVFLASFLAWLK